MGIMQIKKGFLEISENPCKFYGAGGETRTLMTVRPRDFESRASTNFTTPAELVLILLSYLSVKNFIIDNHSIYLSVSHRAVRKQSGE